jgi:hypothetical protein
VEISKNLVFDCKYFSCCSHLKHVWAALASSFSELSGNTLVCVLWIIDSFSLLLFSLSDIVQHIELAYIITLRVNETFGFVFNPLNILSRYDVNTLKVFILELTVDLFMNFWRVTFWSFVRLWNNPPAHRKCQARLNWLQLMEGPQAKLLLFWGF